jgi:hypothetical protein
MSLYCAFGQRFTTAASNENGSTDEILEIFQSASQGHDGSANRMIHFGFPVTSARIIDWYLLSIHVSPDEGTAYLKLCTYITFTVAISCMNTVLCRRLYPISFFKR